MSDDAHHMTAPAEDGRGARGAMANALKDAGLSADQVDYVNAHGTSTPLGDVAESQAVECLMGAHASKVAVSSTKSMTGHALGAAGALEACFSVLAIRDQVLPPTINWIQLVRVAVWITYQTQRVKQRLMSLYPIALDLAAPTEHLSSSGCNACFNPPRTFWPGRCQLFGGDGAALG